MDETDLPNLVQRKKIKPRKERLKKARAETTYLVSDDILKNLPRGRVKDPSDMDLFHRAVALYADRKAGQKIRYHPKLGEAICRAISNGMTLTQVCKALKVRRFAILQWARQRPEFGVAYRAAREALVECWADDVIDIADDKTDDLIEFNGQLVPNSNAVKRSELKIKTRQWVMKSVVPRMYGDKPVDDTVSGKSTPIINVTINANTEQPSTCIELVPTPAAGEGVPE